MTNKTTFIVAHFFIFSLLSGLSSARDNVNCGSLKNGYGPFDYTNYSHQREKLPIVEEHHFTREVEQLQHGKEGRIEGDLDYVLRAFPNHHRALYAMMLLQLRNDKNFVIQRDIYTMQCYLERALRLKPDDAVVYTLYGIYLHKLGKLKESESKYLQAVKINPNAAETRYNFGLLYWDMKQYSKASEQAQFAEKLGYPLRGLQEKLRAKNLTH
ncbi:MAG: tetratricopeptide repeat protein [Hahellaceae bacterium]|nr:tetratricopeptide repeat protein [Hahellaceae bacterium]